MPAKKRQPPAGAATKAAASRKKKNGKVQIAKCHEVRRAALMRKIEEAIRLHMTGMPRCRAAQQAGLGGTLDSAGSNFSNYLKRPEVSTLYDRIREEVEAASYLTLHKIREMRAAIASDKRSSNKDRLKAMADDAAMMGWNKQAEQPNVRVEVVIGIPIEPNG